MGIADDLKRANASRTSLAHEREEQKVKRLRKLLLGSEYESALKDLIEDSDQDRVTKVISEALHERSQKDKSLGFVLSPIVDSAIDESIKQNPKKITNVIFPVMGPAIRKAVSAALSDMVQTLNEILSNSFSVKSWLWRYQAWKSGKTYGEYLLLKALKYRVEQVFLIHKETGLLLCDVSNPIIEKQDPELISSMLSAINDFVHDSFHKAEQLSVDSIRFGEYTLSIMPGPLAVIAAAVKGSPAQELNPLLRSSIEDIHGKHLQSLMNFDGDKDEFLETESILKSCLVTQELPQQKSKPWRAYTALIAILIAIIGQTYITASAHQEKQRILEALGEQSGYVVTNLTMDENTLHIELLRSPESLPPQTILSSFNEGSWDINLKDRIIPLSTNRYLLPYLKELFSLDQTTELTTALSGELVISGSISEDSLQAIKDSSLVTSAFTNVKILNLVITPGKTDVQRSVDQWSSIVSAIQANRIYFESNSDALQAGEQEKLPLLIQQLRQLENIAGDIGITDFKILITGFADPTGSTKANFEVSKARANLIREILTENGLNTQLFVAWGAGNIDTWNLPAHEQRIATLQILHPKLSNYRQ